MPINPLALLVASRNPALSGLLGGGVQGGPGVRPAAPVQRSIQAPAPSSPDPAPAYNPSFFGRLYGGEPDPNVTPEQNKAAARSGKLTTALAILSTIGDRNVHPLAALARGVAAGRGASQDFRDHAFEESRKVASDQQTAELAQEQIQSMRIQRMREQARDRILADTDLLNPQELLGGMLKLSQNGDLEGVNFLQNIEDKLRKTSREDQAEALRHELTVDLDYTDPAALASVAAHMMGSGFVVDAQGFSNLSKTMLEVESANDIKSWVNVGGKILGKDADGNTIVEEAIGRSPDAMAADFRQMQGQQLAIAQAASQEERQAYRQIGNDWRQELNRSGAQEVGQFSNLAKTVPDNAIGHQTLVTIFRKIIDPNSVVRQEEFTSTAEAGGIIQKFLGFENKIKDGTLPPAIVEVLRAEVIRLGELWQQYTNDTLIEPFLQQSYAQGIDPNKIMRDPFNPNRTFPTSAEEPQAGAFGAGGSYGGQR